LPLNLYCHRLVPPTNFYSFFSISFSHSKISSSNSLYPTNIPTPHSSTASLIVSYNNLLSNLSPFISFLISRLHLTDQDSSQISP
jgi:hypothetical protein